MEMGGTPGIGKRDLPATILDKISKNSWCQLALINRPSPSPTTMLVETVTASGEAALICN